MAKLTSCQVNNYSEAVDLLQSHVNIFTFLTERQCYNITRHNSWN